MIAHVVFFEPKPDISAAQRAAFLDALREAVTGIDEVLEARIGRTVAFGVMPENNSSRTTYSYAAVLEFADQPALDRYLRHPKHDGLRKIFWELCLSTLIADVELGNIRSLDL